MDRGFPGETRPDLSLRIQSLYLWSLGLPLLARKFRQSIPMAYNAFIIGKPEQFVDPLADRMHKMTR